MQIKTYRFFLVFLTIVSFINREFLPSGIDYVCFFILLFLFVLPVKKHIVDKESKTLMRTLLILVLVFFANYFLSPYSPPFFLFLFGCFVTIMPFILCYFSHKLDVCANGIISLSDTIIKLAFMFGIIMIVESLFFHVDLDGYALWGTNLFMGGYVTAYQSFGIMLCLSNFYYTKNKKYIAYVAFLFLIIFLSMQLKAIVGCCIFGLTYIIMLRNIKKSLKVALIVLTSIIGLFVFSTSSIFSEKMSDYKEIYTSEEAVEGSARVVLYVKSFEMAKDYFPLGTGQGTFGSIPANITKSKVYDDYGMSGVYGLDFDGPINFRMDTHWASVLGEQGILGLLLYLYLFLFPLKWCKKNKEMPKREYRFVRYIVYSTFLVLIIESFSLPLPNRLGFMFIYAGLCSLITNNKFIQHINNQYEDSVN